VVEPATAVAPEAPAATTTSAATPSSTTPGSTTSAAPSAATITPAAEPERTPEPAAEPAADAEPDKTEKFANLQQQLSSVMDELAQARARATVLGKALFKTKVSVKVDNRAEDQVAVRAALWLDGAPVWNGDSSALADPERVLFSGNIAPGQHVLTYEIEQRARADESYRYTQRASHRFVVRKEHRTELRLVLEDDSDIAEDFADDDEGEYDVRTRLQVRAISPDDE
jgi:hypothetical protein